MKLLAIMLGSFFSAQGAFAKCWSIYELAPTYCVEIQVEDIEVSTQCVVHGKLIRFSTPKADLQDPGHAKALVKGGKITVAVGAKLCSSLKAGKELNGLVQAVCNDTGSSPNYDFIFFSPEETQYIGVAGIAKEGSINCKGW